MVAKVTGKRKRELGPVVPGKFQCFSMCRKLLKVLYNELINSPLIKDSKLTVYSIMGQECRFFNKAVTLSGRILLYILQFNQYK